MRAVGFPATSGLYTAGAQPPRENIAAQAKITSPRMTLFTVFSLAFGVGGSKAVFFEDYYWHTVAGLA
jgi:hypothetical protein